MESADQPFAGLLPVSAFPSSLLFVLVPPRTALRRCIRLHRIGTFPTCVGAGGVGGRHRVVISGSVDQSAIHNAGPARAGKRFIWTSVDIRSLDVIAVCSNRRRPRERDSCIAASGSQTCRGRQIDKQGRLCRVADRSAGTCDSQRQRVGHRQSRGFHGKRGRGAPGTN